MCGICGVLGEPAHWSSAQGRLRLAPPATGRAERARMVRMLNRIARTRNVQISDWQGCAYLVAGATGRQELVPSLAQVWLGLDRVRGGGDGPPGQWGVGRGPERLGGVAIDPVEHGCLGRPPVGGGLTRPPAGRGLNRPPVGAGLPEEPDIGGGGWWTAGCRGTC